MTASGPLPDEIRFGRDGRIAVEVDSQRVLAWQSAPLRLQETGDAIRAALANPLDFPPLEQTVVPGDHIVVALDSDTPAADMILAALWDVFAGREVRPEDVLVLQPAATGPASPTDPRGALPDDVADRIKWRVHEPDTSGENYLATSASGQRLYFAREVIEADLVIPVGPVVFDPLLGYRGTFSVLYPGLSTSDAITRSHGQGHRELEPGDQRPLRQLVDDIGWLLGVQFCVQVVPAAGTGVSGVWAGGPESVLRTACEFLDKSWRVELEERAGIVIASIQPDAGGHGWDQLGRALTVSRNLVTHEGRIVLLTDLDESPGDGLSLIRGVNAPADALSMLRSLAPSDLLPATQCAEATDWARVYLLSELDDELVEDLFITPLKNEDEVGRLLSLPEKCVFLENAQHAFGRVETAD